MPAALTAERPAAKAAAVKKPAPRTAWGDPDLTGIWTGSTITPLERPSELAGKEFLTEQEAADLEKRALAARADGPPPPGDPGTYNQVWFDPASKVVPSRRTSLIVILETAGFRSPRQDARRKRAPGRDTERVRSIHGSTSTPASDASPTACRSTSPATTTTTNFFSRPLRWSSSTSCTTRPASFTRWATACQHPALARRLARPLGRQHAGRRHDQFLPREGAEWQDAWRASRSTTHVVERFTRVDAETMEYQFTWEDPAMFVRPWTAAWPLTTNQASRGVTEGGIFEYVCHEGNYAMTAVLEGRARKRPGTPTGAALVRRDISREL